MKSLDAQFVTELVAGGGEAALARLAGLIIAETAMGAYATMHPDTRDVVVFCRKDGEAFLSMPVNLFLELREP